MNIGLEPLSSTYIPDRRSYIKSVALDLIEKVRKNIQTL